MRVEIHFVYNDTNVDTEVKERGWRSDIYVIVGDHLFNVSVFTIEDFIIDIKEARRWHNYYYFSFPTIVVDDMERSTIIKAISEAIRMNVFIGVQPLLRQPVSLNEGTLIYSEILSDESNDKS